MAGTGGREAQGTGLQACTEASAGDAGHTGSELSEDEGREGREWVKGRRGGLEVTRLKLRTGIILTVVFVFLYAVMWLVLSKLTDSPVPGWDSFITSLSIVATWMLARKIYEHWFLWIVVNSVSAVLFYVKGTLSDSYSLPCVWINVVYRTCCMEENNQK